ncbi:hybrid sensor histidine kinase/response regulator [Synechocystis sp. PCC 7509]|uniref:hybrid sensor histidine kinase/response regulator n=1 Tax=Synechocystis sp. PCC 7509 TaxID=927677 RepID=UPI0002ACF826|nr:hybrid sensor histidine kinase/response regulator [Synechocystis sp. PCC 7509]
MVLDATSLKAILLEARSCFLYEDAPDYLEMLEQGMQKLLTFARNPSSVKPGEIKLEYTVLMRAAHSIKGGAGIAELPALHKLAHKLEDLLEALNEGRVQDQIDTAHELLIIGIEQIKELVAEAIANPESPVIVDDSQLPIAIALDGFLQELAPRQEESEDMAFAAMAVNPFILKTVLEIDLEECLQRIEKLLTPPVQVAALKQGLTGFVEECTLLGQTLNLEWLIAGAETVQKVQNAKVEQLLEMVTKEIAQLREMRSKTLNPAPQISTPVVAAENQPIAQVAPVLNLRIPVTKLDRMSNTLGELLIGHERLSLYHSQLHQANLTLNKQSQKLNPINEQVRVFYDQLASPLASLNASLETSDREFDALQFDQYTGFHSTLQDLQEVMVRVQETKSDIELITRDFQSGLDRLRQQLDSLRGDLTQSRLVPFKFLAQRFVTPLQTLSDRFSKSVELEIINQETLIDQVILEQLQTPLTHLVRNAFDHGIETPQERLNLGKSKTAQITLTSHVQANKVVIAISDNGRGVDTQKVLQRAIETGLHSANAAELTKEQILQFLFMPGFSTANSVTDLSGRGVGLDVVRLQIERLRGTVQVATQVGQGTTFTITIPLTLSILPLLLCRCQQRTLAIPSVNILEIIALAEFCDYSSQPETIMWQDRPTPIFCLTKILPYTRADSVPAADQFNQHLGIVLDVGDKAVVVAVNSLLGERELVLKPFDPTVKVPPYIAGCTVLGTGEVVSVLSPNYLGELIDRKQPLLTLSSPAFKPSSSAKATILIVDDSIAVRKLLDQLLSKSGYQVMQCRDGKEAVEVLNRSGDFYDLVISDIEMPRMDGFTLLREIRTSKNWSNLPVAMLTSRENDQHRQKAKALGANAYFTKPFAPDKLLEAIATLLR